MPDRRELRRLARELLLSPAALEVAIECGLFAEHESRVEMLRRLRQMRRLMDDLGVNAPGAALLVRLRRDLELMQAELARLRRLEARLYGAWHEGIWREMDSNE